MSSKSFDFYVRCCTTSNRYSLRKNALNSLILIDKIRFPLGESHKFRLQDEQIFSRKGVRVCVRIFWFKVLIFSFLLQMLNLKFFKRGVNSNPLVRKVWEGWHSEYSHRTLKSLMIMPNGLKIFPRSWFWWMLILVNQIFVAPTAQLRSSTF